MFGIDNLKKVVKFSCDFTAQINTAMADGKFSWTESFGFIDELAQIPGVIKSFPSVKQEIADLDVAEKKELYDFIVDNFDIPNDHVEKLIENSLAFALAAVELFEQWKAIKK